jgi:hypothetical protein
MAPPPEDSRTWQPFIWDYVCTQPLATHPDDWPGNRLDACASASSLFGLAPGGVCRAVHVAMSAVGSYPTLSPLLRKRSGLLSVALSLRSPSPDVIRHRTSVEPGLSSPRGLSALAERGCPANWQAVLKRPGSRAPEKNGGLNVSALCRRHAFRSVFNGTRRRNPSRRPDRRCGPPSPAWRRACRSRRNSSPPDHSRRSRRQYGRRRQSRYRESHDG